MLSYSYHISHPNTFMTFIKNWREGEAEAFMSEPKGCEKFKKKKHVILIICPILNTCKLLKAPKLLFILNPQAFNMTLITFLTLRKILLD